MSSLRALSVAVVFTASLPLSATKAEADGTFFQLDLGPQTADTVFAGTRDKISFGLNVSAFESGWSAGFNVTSDLVLPDLGTLKIGPSLGASSDDGGVNVGVKIIAERYQPTDFGFVFLSAQYNTTQTDWFALAQFGNGQGFSVDLTTGGSDTYSERTVALNWRLGDGPTSIRAGYRFEANEVFVGVSVNTY